MKAQLVHGQRPRRLLRLAPVALLAGQADAQLPDPLAAGWEGAPVCEVLQADARQRALRCTFPPGVGHERHTHGPHLGYVLAGGRMRVTDATGSRELDLPAGYSWTSNGLRWHEAVNIGDTTAVYLVVEPLDRLTAEQDHARLLEILGIDALRRGADGDPASEYAANYDEARANDKLDSLPELLVTDAGERVDTVDRWWRERRPELVRHFEREIYGHVPEGLPDVRWQVDEPVRAQVGGHAVETQRVTGEVASVARPDIVASIAFTITRPAQFEAPLPVVLELSFGAEFMARLRARFTPEQLTEFSGGGPPWQEQVLASGWAYASFETTVLQADDGDGLQRGIIGIGNDGRPRAPGDWGALRAWAWGASRIVDFLDTRPEFDAGRVAVFGHSRFGKAALVAMAMDERLAAGFISSSGEGGAKLWRRNFGEQAGNIAGSGEYHWVAGNFLRYAGPLDVEDLPVDAHALIALCAPRLVFISAGNDGDQWTDPRGMFLAAANASPVYELLGAGGLGRTGYPPVGTLQGDGALVFRQHELGHTPGPNWSYFLDFAARYFTP